MYQIQMEEYPTQTDNVRQFDQKEDESFMKDTLQEVGDALLKDTKESRQVMTELKRESDQWEYLSRLQTFPRQQEVEAQHDKEVDKIMA